MDHFYVYILQSRVNDSFYKGSTNDLMRRFGEHNNGEEISTSRYLPWDLVWFTIKPIYTRIKRTSGWRALN